MLQGSSSRVRWVPRLTRARLTRAQSEPLPRCGAAAESCTCSGNSIQPCCPPWRALWIRWCGLERTGMRRWEEHQTGFVCLRLLLSRCLSGSDGGEKKQNTGCEDSHVHFTCVKASWMLDFLHECLPTYLPGYNYRLVLPPCAHLNTSF